MAVVNLKQPADGETGTFKVTITDILDANRESIFVKKTVDENNNVSYGPSEITSFSFGGEEITVGDIDEETGKVTIDGEGIDLKFNAANGKFISVGSDDSAKSVALTINGGENSPFTDIDCDFSAMTMFASSGSSTFLAQRGSLEDGTGAGKPQGNMTGISVDASGRIYGSYDNGDKKLLCQIAVAQFSNPAGLEAVGSSLFAATMNSGAFNGIGEDISAVGGKMNTGVLEMSNVDLSTEFTSIITTQRGFQANSRIITTSDTLLEELINLKR